MGTVGTGETVGVALVGSGRMGAFHAETLALRLPHARLAAVVDPAPGAAERLAGALGADRAYTDVAQAWDDPAVRAVVIAAPARAATSARVGLRPWPAGDTPGSLPPPA